MLLPTETTRSDKVEGKTKNSGMDFISSDKDRLSKESMICSEARQAGIVSKDRMSTSECEMSLVKVLSVICAMQMGSPMDLVSKSKYNVRRSLS